MDPKDAQIDSLTRYSKSLTLQLDSVSGVLSRYAWAYTALLDSFKVSKDSAITNLKPACDSIPILKNRISILLAAKDSVSAAGTAEEIEKSKAISNLKQLKELLDAKIITDAEFIAAKKKYLQKL